MIKQGSLNDDFKYELLDENQQFVDLREKLVGLYQSPYCDILWREIKDKDPWLVKNEYYKLFYYEQNVLKHIILFGYSAKTQKRISIINRQFNITLEDIQNITQILFNEFGKVQQIIFKGIFVANPEPLKKIIFEKTYDDVIIPLPKSMDDYLMSLGKKTRRHIKVKMNLVASDFPDFKVQHFEKNDILFEQIENIALLNRNRMKTIGIKSHQNEEACKFQYQYATASGFGSLTACTIDGKMVGGYVSFIIGEHAHVYIGGYDTSYNKYSMGQVAMIHVIQDLIEEKNIKYCHLSGLTHGYKVHLGGMIHDIYTFWVFRNNDITHFCRKLIRGFKFNYEKFKQSLKSNKIFITVFINVKKMKVKLLGV